MGHGVKGREYFLRHIVYSRLSSFEIGVMQGFKDTLVSMPRRAKQAIALYVPCKYPFHLIIYQFYVIYSAIILYFLFLLIIVITAGYLLCDWMEKENWRTHRKNEKAFENDV